MPFEKELEEYETKKEQVLAMGGKDKIQRQHAKGRYTARERIDRLLDPDSFLEDAVKEADYVIEAALEVEEIKRKIFADLDRFAPAHAILATNSSAIVSSRIADVTGRPHKVLNLHFFNPALVMKLVEVVQPHCPNPGWWSIM